MAGLALAVQADRVRSCSVRVGKERGTDGISINETSSYIPPRQRAHDGPRIALHELETERA